MENRAKQFVPFAALKGYEEALREKEKIVVPKVELSEEKKEELDREFAMIKKNSIVKVVYFYKDEYIRVEGMVAKIDKDARILQLVNTKIPFEDIYDIEKES